MTSLYRFVIFISLYRFILHSVTVFDFESNSEMVIDWESTYLEVSLDDATPIIQYQNGHKLSATQ